LTGLSPAAITARLRQRRSPAYVAAMQKLDAGGHVHDRSAADALLAAIAQELPELEIAHLPFGIVARCHLGAPYEVHSLDRDGNIIQHYKSHEAMPPLLERGRHLALHPDYACIEIYADRLIAIRQNGDTAIVQGTA
jgi:hypothetical protein